MNFLFLLGGVKAAGKYVFRALGIASVAFVAVAKNIASFAVGGVGAAAGTSSSFYELADGSLPAGYSFSRASTGTYCDASGVLQTASSGAVRYDYDPTTLAARGVLIEAASANLQVYSDALDHATWTKVNMSVAANAVTAPNGATAGDKLIMASGYASHAAAIYKSLAKAASQKTYAFSIYAKAAEFNTLWLYVRSSSSSANYANSLFNLATCAVVGTPEVAGTFSNVSASIENAGNGWCRCRITLTTGTENSIDPRLYVLHDGASTTGNGSSGLYVWGAQVEEASAASSYIATTSAAVSRSADVLSFTVPSGVTTLRYTFGDGTTQDVAVSSGAYTVPTTLNRQRIKRIQSV